MRRTMLVAAIPALAVLLGWTVRHLELSDSFPKADAVLEAAPTVIWLEFSVAPDLARSSFSVRGPAGNVELAQITTGDKPLVLKADVKGAMPAGAYTVSWAGAPPSDHVVRGRFTFTVRGD